MASMGPECFHPGNTVSSACTISLQHRFNGAGMFPSRKSGVDQLLCAAISALQWGRNVSIPEISGLDIQRVPHLWASMGPECFHPGNKKGGRHRAWVDLLQWGRNVSIPEIKGGLPGLVTKDRLQWGRNVSIPEIQWRRNKPNMAKKLQWGRNVSIPEIDLCQAAQLTLEPLQWGRNVSIPEIMKMSSHHKANRCFNGAGMFPSRKSY